MRLAVDFDIKSGEYGCNPFSDEERPKEVDEAAKQYTESLSTTTGKKEEEFKDVQLDDDDLWDLIINYYYCLSLILILLGLI